MDTDYDQESKMEELSSRRTYHGRRRHNRPDEEDSAVAEECKDKDDSLSAGMEECKSKDDSLSAGIMEESKHSDGTPPRNNASSLPTTKPPLMLTSSSRSYTLRRKPEDKLKARLSHRLRRAADDIPEVHFLGEIKEGIGFKGTSVSCKW